MKVTLAGDGETPAGVLRQSVKHVVEESDAGVDADRLGLACLRGMAFEGLGQPLVRVGGEVAAIDVEGELDLGLVGVAGNRRPARGLCS